ncbi:ATP12 family chaperone protein [Qipengyuania marisflavi]|uniref:Molecular chaperone n=1 Tax=Qipengyuania marisflavi TaxID=2486356 RepID=A0A5S3P667_9SPHN|nr:ATP12 family protein [Qipengyuania marisflavi]TMM48721.1 molecular chaperone [Qipengyuania marisflavi]
MKRFYRDVTVAETAGAYEVRLDGKPLKTQRGAAQSVPTAGLAELLAAEWEQQGEQLDPAAFTFRDMADYALDVVAPDPAAVADKLLAFAETDTLCYRADPDEPFYRRQHAVWEPIVTACEARENIALVRVSGVVHRPQAEATLAALRARLAALDPFTLAAFDQLTALSASLVVGLAALEPYADGKALWDAANLEEIWQAEQWGKDAEAAERTARREADFLAAMQFAAAVRS